MSNKKKAIKNDERKVNVMNGKRNLNGKERQLENNATYLFPTKENMIIMDNLKEGVLRIFEPTADGPVYVQCSNDMDFIVGADLIGEMTINILLEENSVSLKNLRCKDGHEELWEVMLFYLFRFAELYDLKIENKA